MAAPRRDFGSIVRRRAGDGTIMPVNYRGKEPLRPNFYIRLHVGGRWVLRKAGKTKESAKEYLAKIQRDEFEERRLGVRPLAEIPFDRFGEEYLSLVESKHSATTHKSDCLKVRNLLVPYFRARSVASIIDEDVERFHASRAKASPATRNRDLSLLSAMMRVAVRLGYARHNPVAGTRREKEQARPVPYLTLEQQERLMDACPDELRPIVLLALRTGLRQGELLRLEWRDVDLNRAVLTVRESKNKETREVPLIPEAVRVLRGLYAGRTIIPLAGPDRVFAFLPWRWPGNMTRAFQRGVSEAGLPHLRFHDLRHVCAVTLRESGVDSAVLGKWLGHKSPAMVWRYSSHVAQSAAADAAHRLEERLRTSAGRQEETPRRQEAAGG